MSDPGPALQTLLDALRGGLARPEVRAALGDLGRWLITVSESSIAPAAAASHPAAEPPVPAPTEARTRAPASEVELRPSPLAIRGPAIPSTLRIGDSNPLEVVTRGAGIVSTREVPPEPSLLPPGPRRPEVEELPDLRRVAQSARLKADACARAALGETTADLRDQVRALRQGEEEFDGGLWMCAGLDAGGRGRAGEAEPCYRALARAAELGTFLRERDQLHPGLGLEEPFQVMAQAQSMVRAFIEDQRGDDLDQLDVFHWLRTLTSEHRCRVHVARYMRRTDVAAPADAPAVLAALESVHGAWRARLDSAKERRRLFGKVRHKTGLLAAGAEAMTVWTDLERVYGDLAALGVRSNDPELVGALAGVPRPGPGFTPSEGLADALRRADDAARRRDGTPDDADAEPGAARSADVEEAARLLRGRVVLLIGGEVKPARREAIERAFGLRELRWIGANMNDASTTTFEPHVRRPETALVIRMVRFTRTNHGELLDLCKRYSRAFVNLPAGYGVNQLAAEIVAQAGAQLHSLPQAQGHPAEA